MAQEAVGSPGNAVVNVQVVGTDLVITFADSTTRTDALPAGMGGGGGISIAQVDDRVEALVYTWAHVGDTTLIPSDKLRLATSALRGAVFGITNAIVLTRDGHTAATLYGWSRSHVKRLIERIVPAWARDASTLIPTGKLTLAPSGTQVFVNTQEPTGGIYRLDDIWIRDVTASPWQIYVWTGSVWSRTFTAPTYLDAQGVARRG